MAWTSPAARAVWLPRIERIQTAWRAIERESVVERIRDCAIVTLDGVELVERAQGLLRRGVHVLPFQRTLATPDVYQSGVPQPVDGAPSLFRVVIGAADALSRFQRAWDDADDDAIGALLGYPGCCRAAFRLVWRDLGLRDPTWLMAGGLVGPDETRDCLEVDGSPETNVLARFIGVRAVPHLPCHFLCEPSAALGRLLCGVGAAHGFAEEMVWLRQILAWPYEWSALHGIAEIRTPVLKVAVASDATAVKYIVRLTGSAYPDEAAAGIGFPYRMRGSTSRGQPFRAEAGDALTSGGTG